jgi:hypothetical protein
MKTILVFLALVSAGGCHIERELQAEMVQTQLIRIDTVNRYSSAQVQKQQLTWRDSDNMEYVIFVPMNQNYIVGTKMIMLKTR